MRDVGADWDFADVRDHYLRVLHDSSPADADYWERSRHVTGEIMSNVFGEWRRSASESTGGIVLWLRDLAPAPVGAFSTTQDGRSSPGTTSGARWRRLPCGLSTRD